MEYQNRGMNNVPAGNTSPMGHRTTLETPDIQRCTVHHLGIRLGNPTTEPPNLGDTPSDMNHSTAAFEPSESQTVTRLLGGGGGGYGGGGLRLGLAA